MLSDYLVRKLVNGMMLPAPCEICGTTDGSILVHHKDKDRQNNHRSNLQVVCSPCHARLHFKRVSFTAEHKRKIGDKTRARMLGTKMSQEQKEKIRRTLMGRGRGKHLSEETKRKISISCLGRPSAFRGRHHTEETKDILRRQHLGFRHSKKTRERMRLAKLGAKNSSYGKPRSLETRRKISIANRRNRGKAMAAEIMSKSIAQAIEQKGGII